MRGFIQKNHILDIRKNPGLPLQKKVLDACRFLSFFSPAILKEYHDALLFVLAFPADKESVKMANSELFRVTDFIGQAKGYRWQYSLTGSALPGTAIMCQYSRVLLRWLLETCPAAIQPGESAASPAEVKAFFQVMLPGIEFKGATSGNLNLWKRIRDLSGHYKNQEALEWLLELTAQQPISELLKDQLFDGLKLFTSWKLSREGLNRSFLQVTAGRLAWYSSGKKFQLSSLIRKPFKNRMPGPEEKAWLITAARASLAFYYRETDPFTYATAAATYCFDMGDGYRIALYGMTQDRRLSLDSYIGFLAFKNGLPVAYGGGWIFGHRCKIGVNIYPPYRGADSAFLFTQVLRAYYQQYRVHYFLVKPYQFGRGNPEGIKSGAFWFYYKLGFRPATPSIDALATAEWERIQMGKKYRSSSAVLRKLTEAPLLLVLHKQGLTDPRAADLSERITMMIRDQYKGNRVQAIEQASHQWEKMGGSPLNSFKEVSPAIWEDWLLLFFLLAGPKPRKLVWEKLTRLRFKGPEAAFLQAWQDNRHLWAGAAPQIKPR